MVNAKMVRLFSLSALAATAAWVGAGWTVRAGAWQQKVRPYVPRPSEVRPLANGQATAIPPPGKTAPGLASPATSVDDPKRKYVGLEGAEWTVDEKTGITTARDFTYTEDDMVVTGAKARYNKNTSVLDANGNLVLDDPKHHVTGDKAHVDNSRKAKLAIFTGSVVIVLKPKAQPADAPANDVASEKGKGGTITCDRVDDYYKKQFVILRGHLTFKQKITKKDGHTVERTLTADHAEYDGKHDKMHLFVPVEMTDSDGQEAHFEQDVFVGTKEGEETLDSKGRTRLKILIEDDKDDSSDAPPDTKSDAPAKPQPSDKPDNPAPPTGDKQTPPVKKGT